MFKHVIWDFDGTLFDTYPAMATAAARALESRGLPGDYDTAYALMKRSVDVAFLHYNELYGVGDEFKAEYIAQRRLIENDMSAPYPGMPELLRDIVKAGGYNYICTHRGPTVYPMLDKYDLRECFREFVTTENGFARKPAPEGVLYLLEKYGIDKRDAVMVGDRELDILAGQNAGIAGCDYWDGSGEMVACADFVVHDVNELRALILG